MFMCDCKRCVCICVCELLEREREREREREKDLLIVIFVVNKRGDMAIHPAARSGSLNVVKYLIENCAVDVNVSGDVS